VTDSNHILIFYQGNIFENDKYVYETFLKRELRSNYVDLFLGKTFPRVLFVTFKRRNFISNIVLEARRSKDDSSLLLCLSLYVENNQLVGLGSEGAEDLVVIDEDEGEVLPVDRVRQLGEVGQVGVVVDQVDAVTVDGRDQS
jgi:hypothetical protein